MLRAVHGLFLLIAILALLSPFPALGQDERATPVAVSARPVELRVMTFNVWLGGKQVNFAKIVEAIEASGADVVGLQEARGHVREIADGLGWHYADQRMQVISRYPLVDPPGANGLYTFIELRPGEVVAVANVHLPSDPYGPDALREGQSPVEVENLETETQLPALEALLARLPNLVKDGIPVFLTGDFNTPSHLDDKCCTTLADGPIESPLAWPVGAALAEAGFLDSFRIAHPDQVEQPGLTWTPGYPHPVIDPDVSMDRIDWVLAAGNVEVVTSEVVGESNSPDVDIPIMPYPSDHRGVVSTFRVVLGPSPNLVAVHKRAVFHGDEIVVRYHAPGDEGDRISLVLAGGDAASESLMSLPPQESARDGVVIFGTGTLDPGFYEAVLTGSDGSELARSPFLVQSAAARPIVTPSEPVFAVGESISIAWENAPGNKWDWIGIYGAEDTDLENYLGFLYTDAELTGAVVFDEQAFGEPLPPGDYEARLMSDDGYVMLASAPFTVADETE